eukprot:366131-Chlamydomonas_euryale.AAC.5
MHIDASTAPFRPVPPYSADWPLPPPSRILEDQARPARPLAPVSPKTDLALHPREASSTATPLRGHGRGDSPASFLCLAPPGNAVKDVVAERQARLLRQLCRGACGQRHANQRHQLIGVRQHFTKLAHPVPDATQQRSKAEDATAR